MLGIGIDVTFLLVEVWYIVDYPWHSDTWVEFLLAAFWALMLVLDVRHYRRTPKRRTT
jgi:hypothetical protein